MKPERSTKQPMTMAALAEQSLKTARAAIVHSRPVCPEETYSRVIPAKVREGPRRQVLRKPRSMKMPCPPTVKGQIG